MPDHRPDPDETRLAFDQIVQGLELDTEGLDDFDPDPGPDDVEPELASLHPEPAPPDLPDELADFDELPDEPFYREVPAVNLQPRDLPSTLAWAGVIGGPAVLVLCTVVGIWLPRSLVIGIGFTFVAGAIYLISQLPSHGPGQQDGPDDGAVL